jgi:Zn ribbon nucleic-acid-binding protein
MEFESKSWIDDRVTCSQCSGQDKLGLDFTMALQHIINYNQCNICGYKALAPGPKNQSALSVISQVNQDNLYLFVQLCRINAIALAAEVQLDSILNIHFLPNAVDKRQRCIRTTLGRQKKTTCLSIKLCSNGLKAKKYTIQSMSKR